MIESTGMETGPPGKPMVRSDREYFDALEPGTGATVSVEVTHDRMRWVARRGLHAVMEIKEIVPQVLRNPRAIFEGIRWDKDDDEECDGWRCYCGAPDRAFHQDGRRRDPYKDEVFLVFVNEEGVAYQWRWEDCESNDPHLPVDWRTRFGKQVHP